MSTETSLPAVPMGALAPAVAVALGCDVVRLVAEPSVESLGGQAHEGTLGVLRLRGTADTDVGRREYDLVAKCAHDGGNARLTRQIVREAAVYRDSALAALSASMRPARCFGVHVDDDGATWLFLEHHVTDAPPWRSELFESSATALGRFHAASGALDVPVAVRDGRAAFRTFTHVPVITAVVDGLLAAFPAELDSPGVRAVLRFWDRRDALFDALDRGAPTFSHGDYHNGNLFLSAEECVAIDWAYAGPGGLGEDAGTLAGSDYCFRRVSIADFLEMLPRIWTAYLGGLRAAGWAGDERHPRFGFTAIAAFDAGARLLVEDGVGRADPGPDPDVADRAADTVARLDALRPLLAEASALAADLHGIDLL